MKKQISELEQQRFNYLINKQYDEFAAMCDADLQYVHSIGAIDNLSSYIQKLNSGYYVYKHINFDISKVIDMHEYVLVTGNFYADVMLDGKPISLKNRAISIWKKQGDKFKFFMYQGTPFND
ncbi:nuclear transport factor 2 family protein [Psychrobacter sp.]|uniref:nuclear transport factor 2 family protein n=1 Tax=Psychrobacter sp. TaxID=56811 RepID=UPI0025E11A99|nr:nuclear transport factor 2 family protein [Psychrobacter sp.]